MEPKKVKILIIDDIRQNILALNGLVKKNFPDAIILSAESGAEGIEKIAKEDPDVVLLDIMMPEMDGFEVCRRIKSDTSLRDISVVFVTAYKDDRESRIQALEVGADAFIAKPIDESELVAQIRAMVRIKAAKTQSKIEIEQLGAISVDRIATLKEDYNSSLNMLEDIAKQIAAREESEAKLRESEQFLKETQAIAHLGTFTLDIRDGFWSSSEVLDEIFGIDAYFERSVEGWLSLIHLEWQKIMSDYFLEEVIGKKGKFNKKYKIIRQSDQAERWVHGIGTLKFDAENNPIQLIGTIQDITESTEMDLALKESELKYRELVQNSPDAIAIYADGKIRFVNTECLRLMAAQSESDLLGKSVISFVHPDSRADVIARMKIAPTEGTTLPLNEEKFIRIDGTMVEVEVKTMAVRLDDQPAVQLIVRDITERKEAQNKLAKSQEEFIDLFEFAPMAYHEIDTNGCIVRINETELRLLGYTKEEMIGKPIWQFISNPNLSKESTLKKLAGTLSPSEPFEREFIRKDGTILPVLIKDKLLFDAEGNIISIRAAIQDITNIKKGEKEVQHSLSLLYASIESTNDGILVISNEGEISIWNQKFMELWQLPQALIDRKDGDELLNHILNMLLDPNLFSANLLNLHEHAHESSLEVIFLKDGRAIERYTQSQKIEDKIVGRVWSFRDITMQKLVERTLEERQFELEAMVKERTTELEQVSGLNKAIIDNAGMAIATFDRKGNYLSFNNSAEKLSGYEASEVIGKNFFHDFFDEITIRKLCNVPEFTFKKFAHNVLTHSNIISETVFLRKDKTTITTLRSITILRDTKGKIDRIVAVATDISNLKKIERSLLDTQKEMELRNIYLSAVIDNHPGMFWMKDLEGRFIFSNKANNDFIRLTQTIDNYNIIGKKDEDFCTAPLAKQYEREDKAVIAKKKEVLTQDKAQIGTQTHWYEKLKFPVLNPQHQPIGVAGYSIDITQRMEVDAQLRMQSEAFASFALSIVISDNEGMIQWVNHAFETMTGYMSEEVIGKKTNILKTESKDNEFYEALWQTILTGQVWNGEFVNKRKDGSTYYEESTITPVRDNEGTISHFIAIKVDITHRKEMENALHISEERWQLAIEGSGDGVWDLNLVTRKQFTSPQWKAMLGYADHEISENQNEWSSRIHPDDIEKCRVEVSDFLSGKSHSYNNEHRLRCKDGTYKWVASRGKIVERKQNGRPLRVIGTLSDITERKQLEITLRQSIEKERELNELKSRFVSTASHEFRTPLASILITSDMLINYWNRLADTQRLEKLEKIKSTILHLTTIVTDVLQVSKIQEGKIQYNPISLDIVAITREVINEFKEDHRNNIILDTAIYTLMLHVDSRLVRQAITNLISNGLKYTQNGSPVHVSLKTVGNNFILSVKDNGIGIPEEDQKHLFTPFFRASNSKMIQGNGLGLNIIRESAHIHGGEISFTSKINEGSTFMLSLPIKTDLSKLSKNEDQELNENDL